MAKRIYHAAPVWAPIAFYAALAVLTAVFGE
jgi:hypothetical protein